ncbi:hypothetical protein KKC97_00565 [bacterium]|nr:hypothetical protein [bacterium]MBU1636141.1 hypothetical protein [bacterium]MBU1920883.1 hypothetical protein [bacterium]
MPEWQNYAAQTEPELSREHRRIRAALLSLPKETCPVGFEFRLMKRISGGAARGRGRASSSWIVGWAGAGLGVAVAMLVAFTAFDFNYSERVPVRTAGTMQEVPTATVTEQAPDLAAGKSTTIIGDGSEAVQEAPVQLASTPEDSAAMVKRGEIPAGLDRTVSTNGGR